ncbi:MAG: TetR/AcrR family transcriptional regulator, partial [Litorimonas sp.]
VTTRAVAEAARVPVGSVYRYFANADDLLSALFDRMNAGTVGLLRDTLARAPESWRDRVDRTFAHLGEMHAGHPAYGALQVHLDGGEGDAEIARLLEDLVRRDAPRLDSDLIQEVVRTVMAILDGVERRLHRLDEDRRPGALEQARLAVTAYLAHHLDRTE